MGVDELMERVGSDPGFAARLREDPEATLESVGVEPEEGLVEAITEAGDGEDLAVRISKRWRTKG
jgi:hypothetical protein